MGHGWAKAFLPLISFSSYFPTPAQTRQGVHLVLGMSKDTGLGETLELNQGAHVVVLGALEPCARAQLVRDELALYGKRLEESAFNNQVGAGLRLRVCG